MISVKNISYHYTQDKEVLKDISFELEKGKSLAIVGASGSGKSTLLRIISGILTSNIPSNIDGRFQCDILNDNQTPDQYRKSGKLSFMFQESTLMPNLTVRENIELPLKIKGIDDSKKIEDLVKIVGLEDYVNYLPKQLSGGMKTRVALARSFVTNPELLLLDEPFSSLDIAWKSKLYVELEKLRDRYNTTVVIVTHDVQEALLLANKVVVLSNTGIVKATYDIKNRFSISERVNNISSFMKEVYDHYMIPIQEDIMTDTKNEI